MSPKPRIAEDSFDPGAREEHVAYYDVPFPPGFPAVEDQAVGIDGSVIDFHGRLLYTWNK
jgi:hypothetical protein